MKYDKTIWFDFTNVPHVSFLFPIINHFRNFNHIYSVRDFAETKSLFEKTLGKNYFLIGKHKGKNKFRKVIGSLERIPLLYRNIPSFDIKISVGGDASGIVAKLKRKYSITFDDNEKAPNWRYSKFTDLAFWPEAIAKKTLLKQGFKEDKLFQYSGFKEDMYIAGYEPDQSFPESLPFDNYIVLRPENVQANYAEGDSISIVPQLLLRFRTLGKNVLFLPRYESDRKFAETFDNVYVPNSAINGLDACYFSEAVFTGAGTMAREAACLGVPAFSFYTGKELLTVDTNMIESEWMFFSRDPEKLIKVFLDSKKRIPDLERPIMVRSQILGMLDKFFIEKGLM